MENEWREREEPKVRYEQQPNPMDAVKGKRDTKSVGADNNQSGNTRPGRSVSAGPGNELRDKTVRADDDQPDDKSKAKKKPAGATAKRPNLLVQVLNGDILTRDIVVNNLTFVFFILFLLMLMVGKGYYGKQLAKDIDTLDTEVRAKTAEYIENKARLEEATARYRLVEALEKRGLKETVNPAKVIRLKKKKDEQ